MSNYELVRGKTTSCALRGGRWGERSGEKQFITWELITLLKTDLVSEV